MIARVVLQTAKLPKLESKTKLVFTDYGGVQKGAYILKVSCTTLKYNTEKPEASAGIFADTEPSETLKAVSNINKRRIKDIISETMSKNENIELSYFCLLHYLSKVMMRG